MASLSEDFDRSGRVGSGSDLGDSPSPGSMHLIESLLEKTRTNESDESNPPVVRQRASADHYDVAILDASVEHGASIAEALHAEGISVSAFQTKQDFLRFLEVQKIDLAMIVIHSKSWWRDELRLFCDSIRYRQHASNIICVLTWPPACPLDRLFGDTLGVVVFHEG